MCVPSIAPIILGKALIAANSVIISFALSPSDHTIKIGTNLTIVFVTLLTAFNAVALPTSNLSQIDLQVTKILNRKHMI